MRCVLKRLIVIAGGSSECFMFYDSSGEDAAIKAMFSGFCHI